MTHSESKPQTLTFQELCENPEQILQALSDGTEFQLTNEGTPVAKLVPLTSQTPGLAVSRSARRKDGWKTLSFVPMKTIASSEAILDEQRSDRI